MMNNIDTDKEFKEFKKIRESSQKIHIAFNIDTPFIKFNYNKLN